MLLSPQPMHIPDGFLSEWVAIVLWVMSVVGVGYALKRAGRQLGERQAPLLGVLAACIFAAQMLNFPVAGGTSGHLMGAALATILLGPWAAVISLTCVLTVQALVFQDGGLLALGANIFNMALVGVFTAYGVYRAALRLLRGGPASIFAAGFAAAWTSIFSASLACALELALSGASPVNVVVPAMGGIHALIGVGEGLITAGALAFVWANRRNLLAADASAPTAAGDKVFLAGGVVLAVTLAVLSPLASAHPDGLEWVAEQQGFLTAAREPLYQLIPDYVMPGVSNSALATILAGIVGVAIVLTAALGMAYWRRT